MRQKTFSKLITVTLVVTGILFTHVLSAADPSPIPGGQVYRDLKYGKANGNANLLDLYVPTGASTNPVPLIVWIHGGAWEGGDKSYCPAVGAVSYGYAVASLNYRLSQQAVFPAQIQDCKGAIRWLRANAAIYHLDPKHIGAWGDSAGGHLVALLGTTGDDKALEGTVGGNLLQSSRVQASCDWYGPSDLTRLWNDVMNSGKFTEKNPLSRLFGGTLSQKSDLASQASPVTHVTTNAAPFLIMHGDRDDLVPLSQSQELNDALKSAGVPSQLIVVPDSGHGGPEFLNETNKNNIAAFFNRYLKN